MELFFIVYVLNKNILSHIARKGYFIGAFKNFKSDKSDKEEKDIGQYFFNGELR